MKTGEDIIQRLINYSRALADIDLTIAHQNETSVWDNGKFKFNVN